MGNLKNDPPGGGGGRGGVCHYFYFSRTRKIFFLIKKNTFLGVRNNGDLYRGVWDEIWVGAGGGATGDEEVRRQNSPRDPLLGSRWGQLEK